MLIKTRDKWDAASDLLNLLLKDNSKYCNNCGNNWDKKRKTACCEKPEVGSHFTHLKCVVRQNKTRIKNNNDGLGRSKKKTMRSSMAMPPVLFNEWCMAFERLYKEKLLKTPEDLHTCMKRLPFLMTCDVV